MVRKFALVSTAVIGLMTASMGTAAAEGALNIFTFGNYTSPELIKKFEDTYKVKVSITEYDSNDAALAKVRQGGAGYDIVVPSSSVMPIWIKEGLLLETRPDQMENFKNVDPKWVNVDFDKGRHYSVPWVWGATGVTVNTKVYKGDINTSAIFMDPPKELAGKVNVVPDMSDVMPLALFYVGGKQCTDDKAVLRKLRDTLIAAKKKWVSISYGNENLYAGGEFLAGVNWSGASYRSRMLDDAIKFGYPKEGFPLWTDSVAVLKDAKNVENAKLFQNFIMDPKNAALISNFNRYNNGIMGSAEYMDASLKNAPELFPSAELLSHGVFITPCSQDVQTIYNKIWAEVMR